MVCGNARIAHDHVNSAMWNRQRATHRKQAHRELHPMTERQQQ